MSARISRILCSWFFQMRATIFIVSMLSACPTLSESGMPDYMVAAHGRPDLHDDGGSRVLNLVQALPLRCWHSAGNTVDDLRTSPTCAAQVGGNRSTDTSGRSEFAAESRKCSNTICCTPLRCASSPLRFIGTCAAVRADASSPRGVSKRYAAQVGGSRTVHTTDRGD